MPLRRALHSATAAALAAALALPAAAGAHSAFEGSSPAPGARVERAPQAIVLTFTEALNARLSRATVRSVTGGHAVAIETAREGRRLVVRPETALPRGAYRVRWHTVSTDDGHALEGSFSFGVQAPAVGGVQVVEQSPLARSGWLRVLARWLMYAGLLVVAGALLLRIVLGRGGAGWPVPAAVATALGAGRAEALRARERRLVGELALVTAGLAGAVAVADAYDAGGSVTLPVLRDYLLTNTAGITRLAVVACVLLAGIAAYRAPRIAAAPAVLALVALAASGHAKSAPLPALAIAFDATHLVAGATWVGGIALLVALWGPEVRAAEPGARRAIARHVLAAFGRVALPAFAVVVVTGTASAVIELGHLTALGNTGYGRVLALKIFLVACIAAVSREHALRLRPRLPSGGDAPPTALEVRHWRLWRAEPWLGLAVVGAVSFLVAFPLPPRQLSAADRAQASAGPVSACDPCPLPIPRADELAVADHAGAQVVAAWVRRRGAGLQGTIRVLDLRGRPWRGPFGVAGARRSACGTGCAAITTTGPGPLRVTVPAGDRAHVAVLPVRFQPDAGVRARRLLDRAQATMRALRSVRQTERQTSGPGSFARTDFVLRAPDRMRLHTNTGTTSVIIGARQWLRAPGTGGFERQPFGAGAPFSTRSWFRWTPYAIAVRWIGASRDLAQIALIDPGTPLWSRLWIDRRTNRVVRERSINPGHYADERYFGFNSSVRIDAPRGKR